MTTTHTAQAGLPERIYLQVANEDGERHSHIDDSTWCCDQINTTDAEYILAAKAAQPTRNKLLEIIATAYQIAGACDAPTHILDVLADPENSTQAQIDAMLPFAQPTRKALSDAEIDTAIRQGGAS